MRRVTLAAPTAVLTIMLAGCGGSTASRPDVLDDLATDTIVPATELLASDTETLEQAVIDLCAAPNSARLQASHDALAATRTSWSTSEAMWVGPVMERRSWAVIDWPIDAEDIEELIADDSLVLDNERLARRIAANQRGLGAVEYVLGDPSDPQPTLDALRGERRCDYLTGITAVISDEADLLPSDWTIDFEQGGPWVDTFAATDSAGLDMVVNDSLFLLEAIADAELGTALGAMEGPADLDGIVEGPAGLGVADIAAHMRGLRSVLIGNPDNDSEGLAPLLGDDLTTRLTTAFDTADATIEAIDGRLRTAIAEQPDAVATAREAIKEIQTLVATEVVSRLGVTIGFSDADGDTGS